MKKYLILLLIGVSLFVSFGLSTKTAADENQSAFVNVLVTPTPLAEIEKLELDREEVIIPCPLPKSGVRIERSLCSEEMLVKVNATANNRQNPQVIYYYSVSGGKIIGEGEKVTWDLSGAFEGTYTITAQTSDSDKTISKTVKVVACGCCLMPCVCPALAVSGGGQIKAGETVSFTLNMSSSAPDITYKWTVSQGEIIEGQGTRKIIVKTTPEMTGKIKATVEFNAAEVCEPCPRTAFESAEIIK